MSQINIQKWKESNPTMLFYAIKKRQKVDVIVYANIT